MKIATFLAIPRAPVFARKFALDYGDKHAGDVVRDDEREERVEHAVEFSEVPAECRTDCGADTFDD
jgi:hypothetical protein